MKSSNGRGAAAAARALAPIPKDMFMLLEPMHKAPPVDAVCSEQHPLARK